MRKPIALLSRRSVLAGTFSVTVMTRRSQGQEGGDPASQEPTEMKIQMTFDGMTMTATLYDNPSARDFASMLPLDLSIENYSNNEKIAHLPRKLAEQGSGAFSNEQPGDLCYFAPWGNLALFYAGYRYSSGLIRLGRFNDGFDPLLVRGEFPLRIELIQ